MQNAEQQSKETENLPRSDYSGYPGVQPPEIEYQIKSRELAALVPPVLGSILSLMGFGVRFADFFSVQRSAFPIQR